MTQRGSSAAANLTSIHSYFSKRTAFLVLEACNLKLARWTQIRMMVPKMCNVGE